MAEQEQKFLNREQLANLADQARDRQTKLTDGMAELDDEIYAQRYLTVEPNMSFLGVVAATWERLSVLPNLREGVLRRSLQKAERAVQEAQADRDALLVALREKDPEISLPDGSIAKFGVVETSTEPISSVLEDWFRVREATRDLPENWRRQPEDLKSSRDSLKPDLPYLEKGFEDLT